MNSVNNDKIDEIVESIMVIEEDNKMIDQDLEADQLTFDQLDDIMEEINYE